MVSSGDSENGPMSQYGHHGVMPVCTSTVTMGVVMVSQHSLSMDEIITCSPSSGQTSCALNYHYYINVL